MVNSAHCSSMYFWFQAAEVIRYCNVDLPELETGTATYADAFGILHVLGSTRQWLGFVWIDDLSTT